MFMYDDQIIYFYILLLNHPEWRAESLQGKTMLVVLMNIALIIAKPMWKTELPKPFFNHLERFQVGLCATRPYAQEVWLPLPGEITGSNRVTVLLCKGDRPQQRHPGPELWGPVLSAGKSWLVFELVEKILKNHWW